MKNNGQTKCTLLRKIKRTAILRWIDTEDSNFQLGVYFKVASTLRKKCPYSELLWSVFSRIWTEYGKIIIIIIIIIINLFQID